MFVLLLSAQTKQQLTQQAAAQLSTMTPEQIDAKIKEYGMTRAEAEASALAARRAENVATIAQGKAEAAAPKPHKGFILDGLIR